MYLHRSICLLYILFARMPGFDMVEYPFVEKLTVLCDKDQLKKELTILSCSSMQTHIHELYRSILPDVRIATDPVYAPLPICINRNLAAEIALRKNSEQRQRCL